MAVFIPYDIIYWKILLRWLTERNIHQVYDTHMHIIFPYIHEYDIASGNTNTWARAQQHTHTNTQTHTHTHTHTQREREREREDFKMIVVRGMSKNTRELTNDSLPWKVWTWTCTETIIYNATSKKVFRCMFLFTRCTSLTASTAVTATVSYSKNYQHRKRGQVVAIPNLNPSLLIFLIQSDFEGYGERERKKKRKKSERD